MTDTVETSKILFEALTCDSGVIVLPVAIGMSLLLCLSLFLNPIRRAHPVIYQLRNTPQRTDGMVGALIFLSDLQLLRGNPGNKRRIY